MINALHKKLRKVNTSHPQHFWRLVSVLKSTLISVLWDCWVQNCYQRSFQPCLTDTCMTLITPPNQQPLKQFHQNGKNSQTNANKGLPSATARHGHAFFPCRWTHPPPLFHQLLYYTGSYVWMQLRQTHHGNSIHSHHHCGPRS